MGRKTPGRTGDGTVRSAVGQARNMVGGTERRKVKETARPRPYRHRIVGKGSVHPLRSPGKPRPGPFARDRVVTQFR